MTPWIEAFYADRTQSSPDKRGDTNLARGIGRSQRRTGCQSQNAHHVWIFGLRTGVPERADELRQLRNRVDKESDHAIADPVFQAHPLQQILVKESVPNGVPA